MLCLGANGGCGGGFPLTFDLWLAPLCLHYAQIPVCVCVCLYLCVCVCVCVCNPRLSGWLTWKPYYAADWYQRIWAIFCGGFDLSAVCVSPSHSLPVLLSQSSLVRKQPLLRSLSSVQPLQPWKRIGIGEPTLPQDGRTSQFIWTQEATVWLVYITILN